MFKALVIDSKAINDLATISINDESWFKHFYIDSSNRKIQLHYHEGFAYVLGTRDRSTQQKLLIINLDDKEGLLSLNGSEITECFLRILRTSLNSFERHISIPSKWRGFNHKNLFSFRATSSNNGQRVYIDRDSNKLGHVYAYQITSTSKDLENENKIDNSISEDAYLHLDEAARTKPIDTPADSNSIATIMELDELITGGLTAEYDVYDWYQTKLNVPQRTFVDAPLNTPMRLRGPAGSGKTLAMIVKLLLTAYNSEDNKKNTRIAFISHSISALEMAKIIIRSIDKKDILGEGFKYCTVEFHTLQGLANESLRYEEDGLEPISVDGLSGRKDQIDWISESIDAIKVADWNIFHFDCSDEFKEKINTTHGEFKRKSFCWELMNEFGNVLDADGVRDNIERRNKYLTDKRKDWMMTLSSIAERRTVLSIYTKFREKLREYSAISIDQMISDYLGELDSHRWDIKRTSQGFDYIFVDELHLFNKQERMVFQNLTRVINEPPIIIMAFDPKQSPRDTFIGIEEAETESKSSPTPVISNIGKTEKFELVEVFRYTEQIRDFLYSIDRSFPTVDLDENWPEYKGISVKGSGNKPKVTLFNNINMQYKDVFIKAFQFTKSLGRGSRVAVLCLSADDFETYANAGDHKSKFIAIRDRESISEINRARHKFIFSMPEYVAGLQFDTVFLIDVNQGEIDEGITATSSLRKFISQLYLGASRAEKNLFISSRVDKGGLPETIKNTLKHNISELYESKTVQI
ncbi:UvrD-helicase domain-containing protein [Aeromonas bestiarum]|uniref:UvrD-helicase domain-containing protein n=1 Tax=Aeromonas bestiarum TaxID=105751 RepID=UPI0011AF6BEE|nr:UvrD-helicase domain-containing protein [Aeromonas bestiarum]